MKCRTPGRPETRMPEASIQDRSAPDGQCFGCGSQNELGFRIKSLARGDGTIVARWTPGPEHSNGAGSVCGGVLATVLDCHGAAAAVHEMGSDAILTKQFTIEFLQPTPLEAVELVARVVERRTRSVEIEAHAISAGTICATLRGVFVIPRSAA